MEWVASGWKRAWSVGENDRWDWGDGWRVKVEVGVLSGLGCWWCGLDGEGCWVVLGLGMGIGVGTWAWG